MSILIPWRHFDLVCSLSSYDPMRTLTPTASALSLARCRLENFDQGSKCGGFIDEGVGGLCRKHGRPGAAARFLRRSLRACQCLDAMLSAVSLWSLVPGRNLQ